MVAAFPGEAFHDRIVFVHLDKLLTMPLMIYPVSL